MDDGIDGDVVFVVVCGLRGEASNFCDGDSGHETSIVSWCDVFESYSDCVGIGVRRRVWMMCGLGVVFNESSL